MKSEDAVDYYDGYPHPCQYSDDRVVVVDTHDGLTWHLKSWNFEDEGYSEPIGYCPWCGIKLVNQYLEEEY